MTEETVGKKQQVPLLRVEHVKKYYPVKGGIISHTTGYVRAVDDVSFEVYPGETLGLVGESGCGKSTMGRQIVGLEKPTAGRILYDGTDLNGMRGRQKEQVRTQLQMVFQDPFSSLNPRKHIYEILAQPMLYHHLADRTTVGGQIDRLLEMVGLPRNVLGRYPHEFSGGQRQRIGIARALSLNPRFLVCDEPVSALDVSIQAQILNLLRSLSRELNLTCLFVGHGLGAVNYVSDRIAVMYLGKIVEIGPAREVFRHPVHPYTRALIQAAPIPDPEAEADKEVLLLGEAASASAVPAGCRVHPRCPYATEHCRTEEPVLQGGPKPGEPDSHMAACHYARTFRTAGKEGEK